LKGSLLKKPFERSFAVFPNWLWGGAYPGDRDRVVLERKMNGLAECGVKAIFNLMEDDEIDHDGKPFLPYHEEFEQAVEGNTILYTKLPIPDVGVVSVNTMGTYLDRIHTAVSKVPTFIHCWGGRGRTGTVLGCFLVDSGIASGEEALKYLQRVRLLYKDPKANFPAPETLQQQRMVINWQTSSNYAQRYQGAKWKNAVTFVRKIIEWRPNGKE
jgi:protein-tyrosine phosphatase